MMTYLPESLKARIIGFKVDTQATKCLTQPLLLGLLKERQRIYLARSSLPEIRTWPGLVSLIRGCVSHIVNAIMDQDSHSDRIDMAAGALLGPLLAQVTKPQLADDTSAALNIKLCAALIVAFAIEPSEEVGYIPLLPSKEEAVVPTLWSSSASSSTPSESSSRGSSTTSSSSHQSIASDSTSSHASDFLGSSCDDDDAVPDTDNGQHSPLSSIIESINSWVRRIAQSDSALVNGRAGKVNMSMTGSIASDPSRLTPTFEGILGAILCSESSPPADTHPSIRSFSEAIIGKVRPLEVTCSPKETDVEAPPQPAPTSSKRVRVEATVPSEPVTKVVTVEALVDTPQRRVLKLGAIVRANVASVNAQSQRPAAARPTPEQIEQGKIAALQALAATHSHDSSLRVSPHSALARHIRKAGPPSGQPARPLLPGPYKAISLTFTQKKLHRF